MIVKHTKLVLFSSLILLLLIPQADARHDPCEGNTQTKEEIIGLIDNAVEDSQNAINDARAANIAGNAEAAKAANEKLILANNRIDDATNLLGSCFELTAEEKAAVDILKEIVDKRLQESHMILLLTMFGIVVYQLIVIITVIVIGFSVIILLIIYYRRK